MKYTTTIALILFLYFQGTSQEITNIYADKSLDEIIETKMGNIPTKKMIFHFIFSKYPLIKNDLLIHHFKYAFAVDLKSSKQLFFFSYFRSASYLNRGCRIVLLVYDLMDKLVIKKYLHW